MKCGLSDDQFSEVIAFIERYPEVERAILFGSRAMDIYKEASDVDIAILGDRVTDDLAAKIKFDFEEDTYLPFYFDIIAYPTITNEALKGHIDHKGVVIFRRGWRECRLGDLVEKIIDNRGKNPPYAHSGYSVIETGCISGNNKTPDYSVVKKYVDESTYLNWFRSGHPIEKDLLIITVGNGIGSSSIMDKNKAVLTQNLIGLRFSKMASSDFYYYFLNQQPVQELLKSMNIGSAQPSLKVPHILGLEVPVPPISEQKSIAAVLSSLDDKIDFLHRQNKTLEGMAEAFFREWFVEGAKDDWEEGPLGDYVVVIDNRGKTPPYQEDPTGFPIIEINAICNQNRFVDYSSIRKFVLKDTYNTWFRGHLKKYDVFISTVGSIAELAMHLIDFGCIAQNIVALRAKKISPLYLYQYLQNIKDQIKDLDIGSVQPSIKVKHILSINIKIPSSDKLEIFDKQVDLFVSKITNNHLQIQTLEKLRDTLLPKLMSGEVRVTE